MARPGARMNAARAVGAALNVAAAAAEGVAHVLGTMAASQSPRRKPTWSHNAAAADSKDSTPSTASTASTASTVSYASSSDAVREELVALRARLELFDGAMPTRKLDPKALHPSRWAHRHNSSWTSPQFTALKQSIAVNGGNVQPVLVRESGTTGTYEIVFGHRRARACLDLGVQVLAVIWDKPMSDAQLVCCLDLENRERDDPSVYEQGMLYRSALEHRLFASARSLATSAGVSHTWVNKALRVAKLNPAFVAAFSTPLDIQPRHADAIEAAMEQDPVGVLARARELTASVEHEKHGADAVVQRLTGRQGRDVAATPIMVGPRKLGEWRLDRRGQVVITLLPLANEHAVMEPVTKAISAAVLAVETEFPANVLTLNAIAAIEPAVRRI